MLQVNFKQDLEKYKIKRGFGFGLREFFILFIFLCMMSPLFFTLKNVLNLDFIHLVLFSIFTFFFCFMFMFMKINDLHLELFFEDIFYNDIKSKKNRLHTRDIESITGNVKPEKPKKEKKKDKKKKGEKGKKGKNKEDKNKDSVNKKQKQNKKKYQKSKLAIK